MTTPLLELRRAALPLLTLLACGCGDTGSGGTGTLEVIVEREDAIVDGVEPGEGRENMRDGWHARFDAYRLAVGDLELTRVRDQQVVETAVTHVIDLTRVGAAGESLWRFETLAAGDWDLAYWTPLANDGAQRHDSVTTEDFSAIVEAMATYGIAGAISQEQGRSCPPARLASVPEDAMSDGDNAGGDPCYPAPEVAFDWLLPAETRFGPCEVDGIPGLSLAAGAHKTVAITIHGDHLFFNGFPEGSEGGIQRLAQWLADCDLDLDGAVTEDELRTIKPADLPEIDERFQLGGSPISPLDNMWDYVRAQLKTQGHFQGEGECAIDGDHAH